MAYQTFKNRLQAQPLRLIYIFYWVMLAYILAALMFWYLSLNNQTKKIYDFRMQSVSANDPQRAQKEREIESLKDRKIAQYAAESATILLLILAGATLVFRLIRRQLRQSQQLANFMMAITHELKTPIAVTRLNLETMQMRKLNEDQKNQLIRSTIQEANRLNTLCNNMLLTSQIDSGGYTLTSERFDLGILVNDSVEDFTTRFPTRTIDVNVEDENMITSDKLLLQLVINNLLDNALKYSAKDNVVLIKVFQNRGKIFLQVIDEGQGINAAEKGKIFDKYFRGANTRAKGTGLGLYLTKEIVKQHQGAIHVKDNYPRGSVFEIEFKSSKS
ncbi:MAG TPA: ATP-binding protein [Hanamia sp.]